MAKKWIQKAIKRPGALRKEMGAKTTKGPRGGKVKEKISSAKMAKESALLEKQAASGKKLPAGKLRKLHQINLAKTLSGLRKSKGKRK